MPHKSEIEAAGSYRVDRTQVLGVPLTIDGTPVGLSEIVADYSIVPARFFAEVPAGQVWNIYDVVFFIEGVTAVRSDTYGPIAALPNGIVFSVTDALDVPLIPPPPLTIKTTGDFASLPVAAVTILDLGGGSGRSLTAKLELEKGFRTPLRLVEGQRMSVVAQDNFTTATRHSVTLSGHWLRPS